MRFIDRIASASLSALIATYAYRIGAGAEAIWFDTFNVWAFGLFAVLKVIIAVAELFSHPVRNE